MNFKSIAFSLLASMALACPGISSAGVQQYSLNGVVKEYSSPELTSFYAGGTPVSGRLELDDSRPDLSPFFPESAWYYGSVQGNLNIGGVSFAIADGYTGVQHGIGLVSMVAGPLFGVGGEVTTSAIIDGWSLVGWSMTVTDPSLSFSSNAYPNRELIAGDAFWRAMHLTYRNTSGEYAHVIMDVTDVAAIAAIPEPASLLLLGIGALALTARQRKVRKAGDHIVSIPRK